MSKTDGVKSPAQLLKECPQELLYLTEAAQAKGQYDPQSDEAFRWRKVAYALEVIRAGGSLFEVKNEAVLLNEVYQKVLAFFDGDTTKTDDWYRTNNYMLGGVSPKFTINTGRIDKLAAFVDSSLEENEP